jgi:hypothetical protein
MGSQLHDDREPRDGEDWEFYCEECHCSIYCCDDDCPCECHRTEGDEEDE